MEKKKKKKTLKVSSKQKIYVLVGSVESQTILHNPMYDSTIFSILTVLVRWDRKIVRSYDLDHDFDNHA